MKLRASMAENYSGSDRGLWTEGPWTVDCGLNLPTCYIVIRHMARKPKTGPASDPELLILASLASGPKHGYAMMSDIVDFAGVSLGPGTLYTALTRLVDRELIAPESSPGRQRPYRITSQGAAVLSEQLDGMRRLATVGLRRLRLA